MGFKLAELFVPIRIDQAPMQKGLALAHRSLLGLTGAAGRLNVSMRGVSLAMAGVAAPAGYAVKQAIDLEHQYAQIRKTTGLMGEDFQVLKAALQDMATTMAGVSLDEINGIAEMAGRLGIQGVKGILDYTKAVASIKIALDDIPAEEAATSIARILNNFQLGPEAALSFASALNKLDDSSTATGRDILDVAQRLSGTASTLGLAPQKVLALAAALKDAGVENEVGGSAFSQIFAKMASDTAGFAKVAGVSLEAFAAKLRQDPLEAIKAIVAGLARMERLERFKALDQLGLDGVRTAGSLLQLGNVIGRLDGMVSDAESEWQSHASILREVGIRGNETGSQLQLLWNNVRLTAAGVGELLLPVIKRLAEMFGELSTAVRNSVNEQEGRISPWIQTMLDQLDTLAFVWRNWGDLVELEGARIVGQFLYLKSVIGSFTAWSASTLVSGFKAAFDALGTMVENLFKNAVIWGNAIAEHIRSGFMKPLETPKLFGAFEGAQGMVAAGFKPFMMPDRDKGNEAWQEAVLKRISDREAKRLEDKAKARPTPDAAAPDPAKKPDPNGLAPPGKAKKTKSEDARTEDLSSYVRRLSEGVFGRNEQKKQTDLLKQGLAVNKQILGQMQKPARGVPAVAVGPE